tara:strand:- start:759 stop:929 length:171 start_codon:yes stop_codon:yes gene_type:complete
MRKTIEGLPPRCEEIFILSKRNGLSTKEMLQNLGLPIKRLKSDWQSLKVNSGARQG